MTSRLPAMLASGLLLGAVFTFAPPALAQAPDELAQGRQLFSEALSDEEHHRYADALEKYKKVLQIRDTAPIRYRIGLTLEGLGRLNDALEAHNAAVRLAAVSPKDAEVGKAAKTRIDALEPRIAHLTLRPPEGSPAEVRVDDAPISAERLADLHVDPGTHVVTATAPGRQPFRAQVALSDGGRAELPIVFQATPPEAPPPPPPPPPPLPPSGSSTLRTAGIVTGGAGALLLIGGAVFMGLRGGAISDLKSACPGGQCPESKRDSLTSTRSHAVTDTTVGAVLLTTGALALGAGIVMFVVGQPESSSSIPRSGAALRVGPGSLAMEGTF